MVNSSSKTELVKELFLQYLIVWEKNYIELYSLTTTAK